MNRLHVHIYLIGIVVIIGLDALAETGIGAPLKYLSSCEIDLNIDDECDIALLVETVKGRELIVLMRKDHGYNTYVLSRGKLGMILSCHFGQKVYETRAGKGTGKEYKTSGTYLQLSQPEGSTVVYFWDNKTNTFKEVWTSD